MRAEGLQLKQGMRLYLQRDREDGVTEVLPCSLVDYIDQRELIIESINPEHYPSFVKGGCYTTRIVIDERRYAFMTEVLFTIEQPHPRIHLSYPREIEGIFKRSAPRYQLTRPVRLKLQTEQATVSVRVHDISNSGACLIAEKSLANDSDLLNIELRDPFNPSLITLHCLVRYVLLDMVEGQIRYRHGVEFQFNNEEEQLQLERFIEYLLHEQYARPSSGN
ncbi:MAG: PilZ domain-containing protein [Gammaproteobacteria bacterium]|nr:PilZ domain-containing protein [Gammaproteobacteria bacterium]